MKFFDLCKLSFKNLFYNFYRSIASIVMLILLSVIIIFFGGIMKTLNGDIQKNLIDQTEKYGMDMSMIMSEKQNTQEFIELMDEQGLFDTYTMSLYMGVGAFGNVAEAEDETKFRLHPMCMGKENASYTPKLLQGHTWSEDCKGKKYIWIDEETALSTDKKVGDILKFSFNNQNFEYEIRGIISSSSCLLEYTFFDFEGYGVDVTLYQKNLDKVDMDFFKRLEDIDKYLISKYNLQTNAISGSSYNYYLSAMTIKKWATGIGIFLIAVCIGCSIGSILNTIKINISKNNYSLGMMRAIGAKSSEIYWYIVLQWLIIIFIATLIAGIIVAIMTATIMHDIMPMMLRLIFGDIILITTPQISYWAILINIFVLFATIMLSSLVLLRKYTQKPVINILQGGE